MVAGFDTIQPSGSCRGWQESGRMGTAQTSIIKLKNSKIKLTFGLIVPGALSILSY